MTCKRKDSKAKLENVDMNSLRHLRLYKTTSKIEVMTIGITQYAMIGTRFTIPIKTIMAGRKKMIPHNSILMTK
ncbi:hypothetical protein Bcell_3923 [Evansella cellulosilytica DSM 2522]|uniref:Uncharacterized protein n=1 Tax=Evansella cellulosilytica (strain ATCC 21833 / DSM 2522 / FERM P-1141 / JCM 9156 / N-4) TaxID=649639 RepID=E6TVN0_EVAC2|nr:hypothetical protein Bcell_3923 [Evansella cellulosilytica DSM 2522]